MKENLNLNTGVVYAWEIRYFLSKLLTSNYSFQINSTGLNKWVVKILSGQP